MVCEKCNTEISTGLKFCTKCGSKLLEGAPGKGLVKVTGILFIVFGVFGLSSSISNAISNVFVFGDLPEFSLSRSLMIIFMGLRIAGSILYIIVGVLGIKYCKYTEKGKLFKCFAIIVIIHIIVSSIVSILFSQALSTDLGHDTNLLTTIIGVIAWSLFGSILPVLYLIGAQKKINTLRGN